MKFVFGLLSRNIIRLARKRGVEYSFLFVHPAAANSQRSVSFSTGDAYAL
jgi:hypothetical protein